jgi:Flp pilus assembly protein protease CpaA
MIDLATYQPTPLEGVVALALLIACVTDLSTRRIPNGLTLPLWGIGVVWHLVAGLVGGGQWWAGLLGLLVLFPIHLGLFALKIDRGGDAKLMIGVGACLGWWIGVEATLWGILLMLPVSLILATAMGKLGSLWATAVWFGRSWY